MLLTTLLAATLLAGPDTAGVHDLPIFELRAPRPTTKALAVVLSGDGGWADIDQRVGEQLRARGVDVIGFDMRAYLHKGRRTPAGVANDVSRIVHRYLALWQLDSVALIGYSRGANVLPFVANRLAPDERARVSLLAMLAPLVRASFAYHFSDLWRTTSGRGDTPILPELLQVRTQARALKILCVYGHDEAESLCRGAPEGLMTVFTRHGKHHFDGNYAALADLIYAALMTPATPDRPAPLPPATAGRADPAPSRSHG